MKKANWKSFLLCLFVFFIFYVLISGKPFGVSKLKEITGGVGILDLERTYTSEYAYKLLNKLGRTGRKIYLNRILPLDFIFPLVYVTFLSITIGFIYKNLLPRNHYLQRLNIIPMVLGLFDYVENILIMRMLIKYPVKNFRIASFASIMTTSKWFLVSISILIIILGTGTLICVNVKNKCHKVS